MKLKMPKPRDGYIIRRKLFDELSNIENYKVIIIKAGAASGKTTLLSSFINETKMENVKWVALDENANDAFVFWNYVIEAAGEYLEDSRKDLQSFFDNNMQRENLLQILSLFAHKLEMDKDITIVLDDFHMIENDFLISSIDYFIENIPENLHLILLTREIPNIYLGALAMEDKMMIVEEESFKLTEEESREFLIGTLKLNKDEEQIKAIIDSAEGWIGGLQLLAVASREKESKIIKNIKLSNRLLEDYITKEIFQFLTKEEQEFLIETSILRYFSKEICIKYKPNVDFVSVMESILNKNLFVIKMSDSSETYEYHAIFSEYLRGLFNTLNEDKKLELSRLAAKTYYELGDNEETLHQLFNIKDYEKIMELTLKMPQTALIFSYIMKVPMEEIIKNRDFAYQYFFCYYASFDADACERIYNFVCKNMDTEKSFTALKDVNMFFCDVAELQFNKVKILSLEQINSFPLNPVSTAFILIKEAYFLFIASKYDESIKYLDYAEDIYRKTGNIYVGFFALMEKTQIYEEMGEIKKCLQLYKDTEPIINKFKALEACYYIGIAGLNIRQLNLNGAFESLEGARRALPKNSIAATRAYEYTLAEYLYLIDSSEKTEKMLEDILGQEIYRNIYFSARLLRYPICRYNNKKLAKQFLKDYDAADDSMRIMDCDLLYAIIQYENGNKDIALKVLDKISRTARKTRNKLKIIESDLLKVHILLDAKKNEDEIQNLFIEAVSYGAENGIVLPFWYERQTAEKAFMCMKTELKNKLSIDEFEFVSNVLKIDNKSNYSAT